MWESLDILLAVEERGIAKRSLLPADADERERVVAEVRSFDGEEGLGLGAAGYTYMRGAPFGESLDGPPPTAAKLDELRAVFDAKLCALEGHTDFVRSGALCPASPHLFATGSYDHMVKMWDVRGPRCMMTPALLRSSRCSL